MMGTCTRQCFTTRAQSLRRSAMEDGVSQIRARNRRWVDHQSTPYDRIMQGQMYPWSVLSSSCFQVGAVLSARSSPCFPGLHLYGAFSGSMIYIYSFCITIMFRVNALLQRASLAKRVVLGNFRVEGFEPFHTQ